MSRFVLRLYLVAVAVFAAGLTTFAAAQLFTPGRSGGAGSSSGGPSITCSTVGAVLYWDGANVKCDAQTTTDGAGTLGASVQLTAPSVIGNDVQMLTGWIDVLGVLQIRGEGPSGTGFSLDGPIGGDATITGRVRCNDVLTSTINGGDINDNYAALNIGTDSPFPVAFNGPSDVRIEPGGEAYLNTLTLAPPCAQVATEVTTGRVVCGP